MNLDRLPRAVRVLVLGGVTLVFSRVSQPELMVQVPWWLLVLLGGLPLPIIFAKQVDPIYPLIAGFWLLVGLLLGLKAISCLGRGGSLWADLARLPLAFLLLVSAGLALGSSLGSWDTLTRPRVVGSGEVDVSLNAELERFPWGELHEVPDRAVLDASKVVLVDASNHQLYTWAGELLPAGSSAHSLAECDLLILLEESWKDEPGGREWWLLGEDGVANAKRPVQMLHWKLAVVDPYTREIFLRVELDGAVENADYVTLSTQMNDVEAISEWEREHNLPPWPAAREWIAGLLGQ
jgi:hypothetical protein